MYRYERELAAGAIDFNPGYELHRWPTTEPLFGDISFADALTIFPTTSQSVISNYLEASTDNKRLNGEKFIEKTTPFATPCFKKVWSLRAD